MRTFTLDTNCLIDVAEDRPAAVHVKRLLQAARDGLADLALVASSASERQEGGGLLESLLIFEERRSALGFAGLPLLPSIGRIGVSFLDHCLQANEETLGREHEIFEVLFPTSPPEWRDFAAARGLAPEDRESKGYRHWRNRMLDAQAYWAHDHANRDVFVTTDGHFRRLEGLAAFPRAIVKDPTEAAALI